MSSPRYRIAWFSPLPLDEERKALSSAYATAQLLPLLSEDMDIDLYHNSFEGYESYNTYHYLKAAQRHADKPYDFFLYHLEDHPTAQFSRVHTVLKPGIIWFHDYLFSSYGPEPILSSPWQKIASQFYMSVRQFPSRQAKAPQRGPQAFREAAYAHTALFSSACMIGEYQRLRTEVPSITGCNAASYHVPLPIEQIKSERGEACAIGYCGSPNLEDRAHKVLSALAQCGKYYTLHWLIDKKEQGSAETLIREAGVQDCVKLYVGRTPDSWCELLDQVSVTIHLRFSAFGHTGPYLPLSITAGKKVIVSQFGEMDHVPDELVFKIQPGDTEARQLYEVFQAHRDNQLMTMPKVQLEYAQQLHHPEGVALQLRTVLNREYESYQHLLALWHSFEGEARQALCDELKGYERSYDPVCSPYELIVSPFLENLGKEVS